MISQELILGFVIIFIIYVALTVPVKEASITLIALLISFLYKSNEIFDQRFGNIKMEQDIDTIKQQPYRPPSPIKSNTIDNSDVVNSFIEENSNVYYPTNLVPSSSYPSFDRTEQYANINSISGRGYNADESLSRRQAYTSNRNKKALTGAVRSTRNIYDKYFQNELKQNENREWWSSEHSNYENEFRPWI